MAIKESSKQKLDTILLREILWRIEDNIKVILESMADHEAELIRLRRLVDRLLHRFDTLNTQEVSAKGAENGQ